MNTNCKNKPADESVVRHADAGRHNHRATHGTLGRASSVAPQLENRMASDFDPLVPPAAAARMLGTHRVTIHRWVKQGILPPPIRITSHKIGWRQSTLEALLRSRDPEFK